ncbi:hypothetical protein ABT356_00870, partial [Streptosporangium roseum]
MEGREAEEVIDGSITRPMRRPASTPAPPPGGDRPRPRVPEDPGEPQDTGDPAPAPSTPESPTGAEDSEEAGDFGETSAAEAPEEADDSPTLTMRRVHPVAPGELGRREAGATGHSGEETVADTAQKTVKEAAEESDSAKKPDAAQETADNQTIDDTT